MSAWQPISTFKKDGKAVFIHYKNRCGMDRVIRAFYAAKHEIEDDGDSSEYCEERDCYFLIEGWYEMIDNWDEYSSVHVYEGEPDYWMPIPELP